MPKLWRDTVEAHRNEVRDAIQDVTASLVETHGLRGVTMSQIADEVGIGRATLYKYYPDVDAILYAWHDRLVGRHLAELASARDAATDPAQRLQAVLETFADLSRRRGRHNRELAAFLHRDGRAARALKELDDMLCDLIAEAAGAGAVRDDVPAGELASYCIHALGAAGALRSPASARRLVAVTLAALEP